MNPVIVMCVWGRMDLVEINLRLLGSQNCKVIVVTSPGYDGPKIEKMRLPYVEQSNFPNDILGLKWQHGVDVAKQMSADPLIILGSDDFLSEGFVENGVELSKNHDFVYFDRWVIYDKESDKFYSLQYNVTFPLGSGRVFSKKFLERNKWQLFDCTRQRRLDEFAWENTIYEDKLLMNPTGMHLLSVKGKWDAMNPLDRLLNAYRIDWEIVEGVDKHFNFHKPIREIFK